ncbi:hypothetical protein DPMN_016115 [Dreissena polymorpha]|uniref:Uncharacterized protein n=1 Tax=Dreissena polymorpha TaxID=45954 RepID=A0A9D4S497_DREPO|nr:hypothetical protein DPMN_016115 [Dreissena polymorpha]
MHRKSHNFFTDAPRSSLNIVWTGLAQQSSASPTVTWCNLAMTLPIQDAAARTSRELLLPCKHIFGRIMFGGTFKWEMLSLKYRNSPFFTADKEVNGKKEACQFTAVNDRDREDMVADLDTSVGSCETIPDTVAKGKQRVASLKKKWREQLKLLKSKSFLCTDSSSLASSIQQIERISENIPPLLGSSELPQLRKTPRSLKLRRKKRTCDFILTLRVASEISTYTVIVEDHIICEDTIEETASKTITTNTPTIEIESIYKLWKLPRDCDVQVTKVFGSTVTDTDIRSLKEAGWLTNNVGYNVYLNIFFFIKRGNVELALSV